MGNESSTYRRTTYVTSYPQYVDSQGRPIAQPAYQTPNTNVRRVTYDAFGNRKDRTMPANNTHIPHVVHQAPSTVHSVPSNVTILHSPRVTDYELSQETSYLPQPPIYFNSGTTYIAPGTAYSQNVYPQHTRVIYQNGPSIIPYTSLDPRNAQRTGGYTPAVVPVEVHPVYPPHTSSQPPVYDTPNVDPQYEPMPAKNMNSQPVYMNHQPVTSKILHTNEKDYTRPVKRSISPPLLSELNTPDTNLDTSYIVPTQPSPSYNPNIIDDYKVMPPPKYPEPELKGEVEERLQYPVLQEVKDGDVNPSNEPVTSQDSDLNNASDTEQTKNGNKPVKDKKIKKFRFPGAKPEVIGYDFYDEL
eukprot:TRINITY_DN6834_c0_g1_i1.p1 TRINITY_DN6834_c0_g1~~TRINITY_DN6834_c0_g1_i1.p1  ORF type:complete len:358 (-),score=53.47 TRINITY_DN6834_c0_g1_i1:66-1139(-)